MKTEKQIWQTLGIEPTADLTEIKRAYISELKKHHPEEDPKGFQLLRTAYESALEYAKSPASTEYDDGEYDDDGDESDDSDDSDDYDYGDDEDDEDQVFNVDDDEDLPDSVSAFMDRAEALYNDASRRNDPDAWNELLNDDALVRIEYKQKIYHCLGSFLQDSHQISYAVLRLLNECFGWAENPEEALDLFFTEDEMIDIAVSSDDPAVRYRAGSSFFNKGVYLAKSDRVEEALSAFDKLLDVFHGDKDRLISALVAEVRLERADALVESECFEDAISEYSGIVEDYSGDPELRIRKSAVIALINLGKCLSENMDDHKNAVSACDRAIRIIGRDGADGLKEELAIARCNKAVFLMEDRQFKKAIGLFDEVIAEFGDERSEDIQETVAGALNDKGNCLSELGKEKEALAVFEEILDRFKGTLEPAIIAIRASAAYNKADSLSTLGKRKAAVKVYSDMVSEFGLSGNEAVIVNVIKARLDMAMMIAEDGHPDRALSAYDELIESYGESDNDNIVNAIAGAYNGKIYCLAAMERDDELPAVCERFLSLYADSTVPETQMYIAQAMFVKGMSLAESGKAAAAIKVFDELLERFSDDDDGDISAICGEVVKQKKKLSGKKKKGK
ncbi:MAG TPA: tetratricopeptide repeat protein [Spirochaetota bacterium]|nr:tetratricopeptide repeat protein [Spirochaetota bacterium]